MAKQPESRDVSVWRYMDLAKFLTMISTRSLYFPRADLLGDDFEGSVSQINADLYLENYRANPERYTTPPRKEIYRNLRNYTYVNCWHMNECESAAMWSLYGRQKRAIAVKTTYAALADALPEDAVLGMITYLDYRHNLIPANYIHMPYMHKRESFAHEMEVRGVLSNIPQEGSDRTPLRAPVRSSGISIPINLEALVHVVHISPKAPDWYEALLRDLLQRYGTPLELVRSHLDDDPIF